MGLEPVRPGTIIDGIDGFQYITPDADMCRRHVARTMSKDYQEAVTRRKLFVVANGPSARNVDLALIRPTLALNGAMHLFIQQGCAPDFWACCDPQELVVDCLPDNPPYETIYFVASKCHPSVFKKLEGRRVRVWHLPDYPVEGASHIAMASSVTISASWLFHRIGYTDFEYNGWDGCFLGGKHHASNEDDYSGVERIDLNFSGEISQDGERPEVIGGRSFQTTRAWAAEGMGAQQFFQLAKYFDIGVKVNGDGMFEHMRCLQEENLNG